jgi:uncharacterized protein (TIGR02588 family)
VSRRSRARPEWIVFGASLAVLGLLVAAIVAVWVGGQEPADPRVAVASIEERADRFAVEAGVTNEGDMTAANVQVTATLTIGDSVTEAEQVLDFLAGGETKTVVFTFADDPKHGDLELDVDSYADP